MIVTSNVRYTIELNGSDFNNLLMFLGNSTKKSMLECGLSEMQVEALWSLHTSMEECKDDI